MGACEALERLNRPASDLLGIGDEAAKALNKVGIRTIFDLGTSNLFALARSAVETDGPDGLWSRFGLISHDFFAEAALKVRPESLGALPINALRSLSAGQAKELSAALDVKTIRDLANWPPHRAALRLVGQAVDSLRDTGGLSRSHCWRCR